LFLETILPPLPFPCRAATRSTLDALTKKNRFWAGFCNDFVMMAFYNGGQEASLNGLVGHLVCA
jgi:hypothetical protein